MNPDGAANEVLSIVTQAKNGLVEALPNLVVAALVMALGWTLAWGLRRLCLRAFGRVSGEIPAGAVRTAWSEGIAGSRVGPVVAGGVYWFVLLIGSLIAIDTLGLPAISRWIGALASYVPRIAVAVVVILAGVLGGRAARNAVLAAGHLAGPQVRTLGRLAQLAIVTVAGLLAADQLGVDVSLLTTVVLIAIATALGGAALAFGLGARGVVSDILAMHYVHRTYRVGQVIRVGADQGRILRTSRTAVFLENPEGEVSIPGHLFTGDRCVLLTEETADATRD